VPYVLNGGESVGVYCSILRNCLLSGSTQYIFLYLQQTWLLLYHELHIRYRFRALVFVLV
jgi:hypothetical protein